MLSLSSSFGRGDHSAPMTNKSWSLSLDIVISDIDTISLKIVRIVCSAVLINRGE